MHARVLTHHILPGKVEEVSYIFETSVIPAAQQLPGFKGAYLLVALDTGKVLTISLWQTEEDLLLSEMSGYVQRQIEKFDGLTVGLPLVEQYVVGVQAYFSM